MDYKLKDKVVLINGSTGGIGQALARAFAAEGCKLALSSTAQEKLDAFIPTLDIAPENLKTFISTSPRRKRSRPLSTAPRPISATST